MPDYRLQPQKTGGYFAFLLALALLVLVGPTAIIAVLPDKPRESEPVVLDVLDFKESMTELACPPVPDAESNGGWSCGDATLNYYAYPDIKDKDLLLRRMLRVASLETLYVKVPKENEYLKGETSLGAKTASFMADPRAHAAAISIHGEGEHAKDFYVITLTGDQADVLDAAGKIWKSATNEDLPPAAVKKLQDFSKYTISDEHRDNLKETLAV